MSPEQAAAYVNAQTVCALAELASMHAANYTRAQQDHTHAYDEDAFLAVPDRFGLSHNAVVILFQNAAH